MCYIKADRKHQDNNQLVTFLFSKCRQQIVLNHFNHLQIKTLLHFIEDRNLAAAAAAAAAAAGRAILATFPAADSFRFEPRLPIWGLW